MSSNGRMAAWSSLVLSLGVLNASLSFHNIWPTPAVGWSGELSIELAVFALGLSTAATWHQVPSQRILRVFAALWMMLVIGRYATVTAPALWGRELNFYWDLRFLPDVTAMLAGSAPRWMAAAAIGAALGILAIGYWTIAVALARVRAAATDQTQRRFLVLVSVVVLTLFVASRARPGTLALPRFPEPVVSVYARQVAFLARALTGSPSLPASPAFESDLSRVKGADVLVLFLESYGAVTYERPDFSTALEPDRRTFARAIHESGHDVVSAFVESPTFGGSSWFAHVTLLSGIEVRDPDTNALLMTARRPTLPALFARRGYRTLAVMPGMWSPWPEGAFYGFTDTYSGARLGYEGPPFGWWDLPDQFTLAKLDTLEMTQPARQPLFVFLPTVSTHTPFTPTPPYQPDWSRMLSAQPFHPDILARAYDEQPDWMNLAPGYVHAVSYAYDTLAGYVRQHTGGDFVMVLIGDHQPPALVSGEGAPWDVPVHVVTNRTSVLERLRAHGFRAGLSPTRPALGRMHELVPILLDAFGDKF